MRIHSDVITPADLFAAASRAGVTVDDWSIHGSRTRAAAIKFYVLGSSCHRPQNTRGRGPDDYAATWDEWGILLGHLFSVDPDAHTGRYGYRSANDFHFQTGHRFVPGFITPDMQHKRHRWQPWGGREFGCDCGAVLRQSDMQTGPIGASDRVMKTSGDGSMTQPPCDVMDMAALLWALDQPDRKVATESLRYAIRAYGGVV